MTGTRTTERQQRNDAGASCLKRVILERRRHLPAAHDVTKIVREMWREGSPSVPVAPFSRDNQNSRPEAAPGSSSSTRAHSRVPGPPPRLPQPRAPFDPRAAS